MSKDGIEMEEMSFWDHLEDLRGVIFKSLGFVIIAALGLFIAMPYLFDNVILAPCHGDFVLYQWLCKLNQYVYILPDYCGEEFGVNIQSIKLASQFFTHMTTSFYLAVVLGFPFLIYQIWSFISPALYEHEKKNIRWAFLFGNIMFFMGVAVGYLTVFPITLRFLVGYQISTEIPNIITLDSYMDNFMTLIFVMGLVFEMPLLSWILSNMGVLNRRFFNEFRRHAIVFTLILAAFITPSSDPFTLSVVFIPLYMLWEVSALFVKPAPKLEDDDDDED